MLWGKAYLTAYWLKHFAMDKIKFYQQSIKGIYQDIVKAYKGATNPLDVHLIFDEENHHYQLLMLGWQGDDYIFQCLVHIDIKQEKIWIQWIDTEYVITEDLLKKGIPATAIVLGLKHPDYRQYTDFAVA